jgi:uncharacterized protein YecT (DUF1311 family)
MRRFLSILLLLLPIVALGQSQDQKRPWDIGCDTLDKQYDMNICSYRAAVIADSVLAQQYDQLVAYLDTYYEKEVKALTQPPTELDKKFLATLESQKAAVLASREAFDVYRGHMVNIMGEQYAGGSIRPLIENMYALELTVNQINLLNKMMEEISPQHNWQQQKQGPR